jgi:O-antigen ligase
LSIIWAYDRLNTGAALLSLITTVISALVIATVVPFRTYVRACCFLFFGAALLSIVFIRFIPSWGLMTVVGDNINSVLIGVPQGVFKHKNLFSEAISLGIIAVVSAGRLISLPLRAFMLVVMAYCLTVAQSATPIMSCSLALLLTYFAGWTGRLFGRWIGATLVLMSVSIFGVLFLMVDLDFAFGFLGRDATLTGRLEIWQHVGRLFLDRPWTGYGLGSIWKTDLGFVPGLPVVPHAHNMWLEAGLMGGLPLIIILFLITVWAVVRGIAQGSTNGGVGFLATALALQIVFRMLVEVDFKGNDPTFFMLLTATCYVRNAEVARAMARRFSLALRARFAATQAQDSAVPRAAEPGGCV